MTPPTRITRVLVLASTKDGTTNADVAKALHVSAEQAGATLSTMVAHGKLFGAKLPGQTMPKRFFTTQKALTAWLKLHAHLTRPTENWTTVVRTTSRIQRATCTKTGLGTPSKTVASASAGIALGYDARVQVGPEFAGGPFSAAGIGRYVDEPASCAARAVEGGS